MSLELPFEVWSALHNYIDVNDRRDAAYDLVTLLIDLNYEPSEIKEHFGSDRDISRALKDYSKDHDDEDDGYGELDFEDQPDWDE